MNDSSVEIGRVICL